MTKQAIFTGIAITAMMLVSKIDYHILLKYAKYAYPVAIVLGITVLFFGKEVNGQRRWFALGPISFQPAEFAKIVLILCLARLSEIVYDKLDTYRMVFLFAGVTIPILFQSFRLI